MADKSKREIEETKNILNVIRSAKSSQNLVNEILVPANTNQNSQQTVASDNKVNPQTVKEEESKFMDAVTPRVTFQGFNVYPDKNEAVLSGVLTSYNNLAFNFYLSRNDGCYIKSENIPLTDELLETLKKLYGYYNVWANDWSQKINNYKQV